MSTPPATARPVEHALDCALSPPSTREACRGECVGPPPSYPLVEVRRVSYYLVPVPEHVQHDPDAAELHARGVLDELPISDHEFYAANPDRTHETYTARKGP